MQKTPKEIIYRSKDNGCFHVSSFDDMVLNPIEIEKHYYGLHMSNYLQEKLDKRDD